MNVRRRKGRKLRVKAAGHPSAWTATKVPQAKAIHESRSKSRAQRKARRKNR